MRRLIPLALLALTACASNDVAAPADPTPRALLEARAQQLRRDIARFRFTATVAVDSLPITTPGAQRVRVEVAALSRVADSLSFITAQLAALPR